MFEWPVGMQGGNRKTQQQTGRKNSSLISDCGNPEPKTEIQSGAATFLDFGAGPTGRCLSGRGLIREFIGHLSVPLGTLACRMLHVLQSKQAQALVFGRALGSVGKGTEAKGSVQASPHLSSPLLRWFLNVFVGMLGLGFEVSALGVGRRGKGIPTSEIPLPHFDCREQGISELLSIL